MACGLPGPRLLSLRLLLACSALAAAVGCAGIKTGDTGSGGSSGSGASSGSGGGPPGSGSGGNMASGHGGSNGTSGSGGSGPICDMFTVNFVPKVPTVTLLVDRSGSMFPCLGSSDQTSPCTDHSNSAWGKFQAAVLPVVQSLQAQVRFGFTSFTGTDASHGNMCPMLNKVPAALNNYQPIADAYQGLPFRTSNDKWETPSALTLKMSGADLMADTTPGDKYILFVTDGQPDYCDDSNALCAPDSVVGALQQIHDVGVTTIVLGLQSPLGDLPPGTLQAFANAGAGEPTVAPLRTGGTINDFFDQCNGLLPWHNDLVAAAKPQTRGSSVGTYQPTPGPTKPFTPSITDQAGLTAQISTALSGVKSCTFDLTGHKVDLTQLNKAGVKIQGMDIPLSDSNGWHMLTETQLELVGPACDTWRKPETTTIDFAFPCEIIVPT